MQPCDTEALASRLELEMYTVEILNSELSPHPGPYWGGVWRHVTCDRSVTVQVQEGRTPHLSQSHLKT